MVSQISTSLHARPAAHGLSQEVRRNGAQGEQEGEREREEDEGADEPGTVLPQRVDGRVPVLAPRVGLRRHFFLHALDVLLPQPLGALFLVLLPAVRLLVFRVQSRKVEPARREPAPLPPGAAVEPVERVAAAGEPTAATEAAGTAAEAARRAAAHHAEEDLRVDVAHSAAHAAHTAHAAAAAEHVRHVDVVAVVVLGAFPVWWLAEALPKILKPCKREELTEGC